MNRPPNQKQSTPIVSPLSISDHAILCRDVVKTFGRTIALDGLTLSVPRGAVYALLGRNGVGKSTLIQLLMGMLEPDKGTISVLGLDPVRDDIAVKQKLGYIPERMPMYDWMTVNQILSFVAGIYSHWSFEDEMLLCGQFQLDRTQKVGALSRGKRALLSLVIAMAHQPELVLLDECTSGMDAIARQEFERSVIEALSSSGRTVLFAGHQIDEMERICDWVGILHNGRLLLEMPLEELKSTVFTLRVTADDALPLTISNGTLLSSRTAGKETLLTIRSHSAPANTADHLADGYTVHETIPLSLEEIFVALVGHEDSK